MQRTTHPSRMVYVDVCLLVVCLLITASHLMAAAACMPLPADLVAWWPGNTDAQDISGNRQNAVLQPGAQAGVPGLVAGAFQFDGVAGVADTPVLLPQQGTVELWINPATLTSAHNIIGTFGTANGNNRLWIAATGPGGGPGVGPNRFVVNLGSCCVNDIDIPTPLVLGTWTHVALTFDYGADQYTLYFNGLAVATSTAARNAPTRAVSFGAIKSDFGQSFFFPGRLDEVTLYRRVLAASEILAIFQAGSAGKCIPAGPALSIVLTGCTTCQAGDTFSVRATITNHTSTPVSVEFKAGVILPNGTEVNVWAVADKHFTIQLPAGLDLTGEILRVQLPAGLPQGVWSYEAALLGPELGRTIARDAKPFTMQ